MDLAMIEDHLELVRGHVALGERHIRRQREIVAELSDSSPYYAQELHAQAVVLLRNFEDMQELHVADRDRLEHMLAAARTRS